MKSKVIALAATVALLAGCSEVEKPAERPSATLEGTAADNIIRNGDVRVYRWDGQEREILLTTKTDNYGYYQDPLQSEDQFIKVCVVGGEYTEEASLINIKLEDGDRLCAVTYWESGQQQEVMVTPETNMAVALMEYEVKSGKSNLQNIVSGANSKIGTMFGYDILTTRPADMTSSDLAYTGLNDSVRSGLWHAAFSRIALNAAIENGQKNHTSLLSSMTLHKAIYRDIAADGKLDGWGLAENGKTKVRLGLGAYELNANVYRTELAKELVNFVQSDKNKTAVRTTDVLSYANTFSVSTDSLFDEKDLPVPFDSDAPSVSFDTPANTYISGTYVLGVKVTDFSGVKSVNYTLNGGNSEVFDFSQDKLVINTKDFSSGELELALTVVDKLDNTAVVKRIFRVTNEQPVVNIASKQLVNNSDYKFLADVGEVVAGVLKVEVNNRSADFADSVISADLRLSEGTNNIPVKITDNTGAEYTYNFSVVADLTKPNIEFKSVRWKTLIKSGANVGEGELNRIMSTNKIFITPNLFKLDGIFVDENELAKKNWPTYKIVVSDPKNGADNYATLPENLKVNLIYSNKSGSEIYFTRGLTPNDKGEILIPLSKEYLGGVSEGDGKEWYEKDGIKLLTINAYDEAGNTNSSFTIEFDLAVSAPSVSPSFSQSSKGSIEVDLKGTDITGVDSILVTVDGSSQKINIDWSNPVFTLDTTNLADGTRYISVQIITGGISYAPQTFEFHVDNTKPEIKFTSADLIGWNSTGVLTNDYTLKGIVNDFEGSPTFGSGIKSLTYYINSGNSKPLPFQNTTINQAGLKLTSGDNEISVTAEDIAGNITTEKLHVLFDDYLPVYQHSIKDNKIFDKITDNLFFNALDVGNPNANPNNFNVLVGYTHAPEASGMNELLKINESSYRPFYLDSENNNLENLSLVHVNNEADALNPDGSLNLMHSAAAGFLKSGRGKLNKGIPHFDFTVSDSQYSTGEQAFKAVNATKLKVYLTVRFDGVLVGSKRLLNPVNVGSNSSSQRYLVPITKELFTEGLLNQQPFNKITASFELVDEAGNTTTKSHEFKVFNKPDSDVVPTFTGGLNTTITNGNLTLSLVAKSVNGLSRVHLKDNNNEANNWEWTSEGRTTQADTVTVPTKTVTAEGSYSWTLTITDLAGNTTTETFAGVIDKTPPKLEIKTPPSTVTGPYWLSFTVEDTHGLATVVANGQSMSSLEKKELSTLITPTGADGARNIKVIATDKAGNSTTKSVTITYDHNPPNYSAALVKQSDGNYYLVELTFSKPVQILNDMTFHLIQNGKVIYTEKFNMFSGGKNFTDQFYTKTTIPGAWQNSGDKKYTGEYIIKAANGKTLTIDGAALSSW